MASLDSLFNLTQYQSPQSILKQNSTSGYYQQGPKYFDQNNKLNLMSAEVPSPTVYNQEIPIRSNWSIINGYQPSIIRPIDSGPFIKGS